MSNRSINLLGWALFTGSAVAFLIASWPAFWSTVGSALFLIACLVFLVPYFRRG